jgi:hypothetical protein
MTLLSKYAHRYGIERVVIIVSRTEDAIPDDVKTVNPHMGTRVMSFSHFVGTGPSTDRAFASLYYCVGTTQLLHIVPDSRLSSATPMFRRSTDAVLTALRY